MYFLILISLIAQPRRAMQEFYDSGNYLAVVEMANQSLKDSTLTKEDSIGIHTILAFSYVALDKPRLARLEFSEILAMKPNMTLDPVFVPPKIMKTFEQAKREFKERQTTGEVIIAPMDIGIREKPTLFTTLVPGLYDIKYDNKLRGYSLLGGEVLSISGTIISIYTCSKAHQDYLNATSGIEEKYKQYTFWYRSKCAFIISTIAIPVINYLLLALSK